MLELEKHFVFRKFLSFWWYNFLSLSKLLVSNNEQKQYLGFIGHKTLICEHTTHNISFPISPIHENIIFLFSLVLSFPISHLFWLPFYLPVWLCQLFIQLQVLHLFSRWIMLPRLLHVVQILGFTCTKKFFNFHNRIYILPHQNSYFTYILP